MSKRRDPEQVQVVGELPGPRGGGRHPSPVTAKLLELCPKNPGKWVSMGETTNASNYRVTLERHHPEGVWQAATRNGEGFIRWDAK